MKRVLLSILLIAACGLVSYGNSVNGEFIWDDDALVRNNVLIRDVAHMPKIFTGNVEAGSGGKTSFYRPVQTLTYMLDYVIWKLNAKGYHATNIFWHISVAMVLFWLVFILFRNLFLALLTALFFVAHPIHTEAVSYISGRAEMLSAFFVLLSFVFYLKSLYSKKTWPYFAMVLCYAAALLSKEGAIIFPIMLAGYHYTFKEKFRLKQSLLIVGITGLYLVLRLTLLKSLLTHISYDPNMTVVSTTLWQRIPGFFVAATNYLRLLIFPHGLHMEYGNELFRFSDVRAVSGLVLLVGLLFFAFRKKENSRPVFFSIIWFIIALLPVSNLYPLNAYMAEHWLYLPSAGFFLLLAQGGEFLCRRKSFRQTVYVLITIILSCWVIITYKQNDYWRDPVSFYQRTLKYSPNNYRLYTNLGNAYSLDGKYDKAIQAYEMSIAVNLTGRQYAEPRNGLGVAYIHLGEMEQATGELMQAVRIDPEYAQAHYNLGQVYKVMKKAPEAIRSFQKVIELDPLFARAHYALSEVYYREGEFGLALQHADKAAELDCEMDPDFLRKLEQYRSRQGLATHLIGEGS